MLYCIYRILLKDNKHFQIQVIFHTSFTGYLIVNYHIFVYSFHGNWFFLGRKIICIFAWLDIRYKKLFVAFCSFFPGSLTKKLLDRKNYSCSAEKKVFPSANTFFHFLPLWKISCHMDRKLKKVQHWKPFFKMHLFWVKSFPIILLHTVFLYTVSAQTSFSFYPKILGFLNSCQIFLCLAR